MECQRFEHSDNGRNSTKVEHVRKSKWESNSQNKLRRTLIADKLENERELRRERPRGLSNHVISRFYRPPEIILMEKHYDSSVDIWSAGCIFAELLTCVHADKKLTMKDKILFPGKSCYPLSPEGQNNGNNSEKEGENEGEMHISSKDQIKYICRIIGTPKDADKSFITDEAAMQYLEMSLKHKHKNKLNSVFEKSDPQAVSLLNEMLQFNPYMRISAKDALQHPVFEKVRHAHFERPCPIQINQKIFNQDAYDYVDFKPTKYTVSDYKRMLLKEVKEIKKLSQLYKT